MFLGFSVVFAIIGFTMLVGFLTLLFLDGFDAKLFILMIVCIVISVASYEYGSDVDLERAFENMNISTEYEVVLSVDDFHIKTENHNFRNMDVDFEGEDEIGQQLFEMLGEVSKDGVEAGDKVERKILEGDFYAWLLELRIVGK